MAVTFPFLTAADPVGTSEGSLDPLGLYQIADLLGTELVPAVRERMLRVRFLTAMAVGAIVTEGLEADPRHREAAPYLVWEWYVVEAIVRAAEDDEDTGGVPGIGVTRRAVKHYDHLDARTYLATPRVFGFNGVYKRLAVQLGIMNVHLAPGPAAERIVDAWARDLGHADIRGAEPLIARWRAAIERALGQSPPGTRPGWNRETWRELAQAFLPTTAKRRERRLLRDMLTTRGDDRIGALPEIWDCQEGYSAETFSEEKLHNKLETLDPARGPLLAAIRAYETFARSLQDAFDTLRFVAGTADARGFQVPDIAARVEFQESITGLDEHYDRTCQTLAALSSKISAVGSQFAHRFAAFAEPLSPGDAALAIVKLHGDVQKAKSATGKREWFDHLGGERIHVRRSYRLAEFTPSPGKYLHAYRGRPIGRFRADLT